MCVFISQWELRESAPSAPAPALNRCSAAFRALQPPASRGSPSLAGPFAAPAEHSVPPHAFGAEFSPPAVHLGRAALPPAHLPAPRRFPGRPAASQINFPRPLLFSSPVPAAHLGSHPPGSAVTPMQGARPTFPRSGRRGAGPGGEQRSPRGAARFIPARLNPTRPAPAPRPRIRRSPRSLRRLRLPRTAPRCSPPASPPHRCKRTANFGLLPPSTPSPSPLATHTPPSPL